MTAIPAHRRLNQENCKFEALYRNKNYYLIPRVLKGRRQRCHTDLKFHKQSFLPSPA